MTDIELERCKAFLDAFNVDYKEDIMYQDKAGCSIIMNPDTEWKEFLGHSINSVACAVASKLGKKIYWRPE